MTPEAERIASIAKGLSRTQRDAVDHLHVGNGWGRGWRKQTRYALFSLGLNPPLYVDRAHPHDSGKLRYMTQSGGYVMARRPRCMPFVMSEKEWRNLAAFVEGAAS